MKIYIIHYSKLNERRQYMEKQFNDKYKFAESRSSANTEFITAHDRESLSSQDTALFNTKQLVPSEMSVIRKHLAAYEKLCGEEGEDYALILEDDATLDFDFERKLTGYIEQLPYNWDLCFIGSGCGLHVPDSIINKHAKDNNIFRKSNYPSWGGNGASKCSDSYLISKNAAYKMLEYLDKDDYKISKEQDHLINEIALFKILRSYWVEPTIVKQESDLQHGKFKSSLDGGRHNRNHKLMEDRKKDVLEEILRKKTDDLKRIKNEREAQQGNVMTSRTAIKNTTNHNRKIAALPKAGALRPIGLSGVNNTLGRRPSLAPPSLAPSNPAPSNPGQARPKITHRPIQNTKSRFSKFSF